MKKKLLILGISGLTGFKIANLAFDKFETYGTYNIRPTTLHNCETLKLNLTNDYNVKKIFSQIRPDVVINTTALHNVDFCEENKELAAAVNTNVIKKLRENAEKYGSRVIHISTDYVFDGNSNKPYKESDQTNPISFYGQSKLDGERVLKGTDHIIVRPSVVYGWTSRELGGTTSSSGKPINFAMWVITKLHKNEPLKIVTDQRASATLADSLAESILAMISSNKSGVYHVSGLSCESRYEFTIKLARKFGYLESLISPVSSSEFVQKAKRPSYSCLNCDRAVKEFDLKLLRTEEALDIMKSQVEKEAPHLLVNDK